MSHRVTVEEAATQLPDLLERVCHEHETFLIVSGDEEIGILSPAPSGRDATLGTLLDLLQTLDRPDKRFADDLEEIQTHQTPAGDVPWPS